MSNTLQDYLIRTFANSAETRIEPATGSGVQAPDVDRAPRSHVVEINLKGGVQGKCVLVMEAEQARLIASRVLTIAVDSEFPPENVDDDLASNTVGELINIALGEYFSARKDKPGAVELSSPRYSRLEKESGMLQQLDNRITFACDEELFDVYFEF